ncbi:MAG TPA: F0F1 ATP synthase subunit gamma [Methylomirabilota bacterium]|nr:F0F1 ATP synthase subunit gamma [Methylomirabilota bacterium]
MSRRIATTEDLRAIVRTMKSLSAVSVRQYESAVAALRDYSRTVELALQALLRDRPAVVGVAAPAAGPAAVVVFGSDHGLCGRFNDEVAHFAGERLRELDAAGARRRCLAVGARAEARLAALGEAVDERLFLPGSVSGLAALAQAVLVQIDTWGTVEGPGRVLLIHQRRTGEAVAVPHMRQLLPLSRERLRNLAARRWPSRRLPMFTMDAERLWPAVIRQYLFSSVYRAAAESLASEHASRLASMQAAERNIEEHLEEQQAEFRRRRQETITEELLDIVSGFEASASVSRGAYGG